jgi:SprT protein
MIHSDIEKISEVITEFWDKGKRMYRVDWERPVFNFKLSGRTAGRAALQANLVKINEELFVRNREEFLAQTIPHEVAHLLAWRAFKDNGHGYGWKRVMVNFGLEPRRCHNYDTSEVARRVSRYLYTCGCPGGVKVGSKHHKQLMQGAISIRCRGCRVVLNKEHFTNKKV